MKLAASQDGFDVIVRSSRINANEIADITQKIPYRYVRLQY